MECDIVHQSGRSPSQDADFDGDQVSIRGVFTQEANEEADKIIRSTKHYLDITGSNVRKLTNEAVHALYELTRD